MSNIFIYSGTGRVGITIDTGMYMPADEESPDDEEAAERTIQMYVSVQISNLLAFCFIKRYFFHFYQVWLACSSNFLR